MTITSVLPVAAVLLFLAFALYTLQPEGGARAGAWRFPALLSAVFLIYSLVTVFAEGPFGFWTEHVRDLWGNQIWFDLLLAIGIGWFFIVPQARAVGMRPLPWLVLILGTGCIGLLAMLARMLYLKEQAGRPALA